MKTDTPQTDERTYPADCLGKTPVVNADWAKLLERENAALRKEKNEMFTEQEVFTAAKAVFTQLLNKKP